MTSMSTEGRITLWSPWSLALAACLAGFALIGVSVLTASPAVAGPAAQVGYLTMTVVATYVAYRAAVRRVTVTGTTITRKPWIGKREQLQIVSVQDLDADTPSSLLWRTSMPVVTTTSGQEICLSELAGYDAFRRRNRRVQRACKILNTAVSPPPNAPP